MTSATVQEVIKCFKKSQTYTATIVLIFSLFTAMNAEKNEINLTKQKWDSVQKVLDVMKVFLVYEFRPTRGNFDNLMYRVRITLILRIAYHHHQNTLAP